MFVPKLDPQVVRQVFDNWLGFVTSFGLRFFQLSSQVGTFWSIEPYPEVF